MVKPTVGNVAELLTHDPSISYKKIHDGEAISPHMNFRVEIDDANPNIDTEVTSNVKKDPISLRKLRR